MPGSGAAYRDVAVSRVDQVHHPRAGAVQARGLGQANTRPGGQLGGHAAHRGSSCSSRRRARAADCTA